MAPDRVLHQPTSPMRPVWAAACTAAAWGSTGAGFVRRAAAWLVLGCCLDASHALVHASACGVPSRRAAATRHASHRGTRFVSDSPM